MIYDVANPGMRLPIPPNWFGCDDASSECGEAQGFKIFLL